MVINPSIRKGIVGERIYIIEIRINLILDNPSLKH
jgi:hypothetical protein